MRQYEVNVGKACNNACVFCSNGVVPPEERRFVALEQVFAELETARSQGYEAVGFLGGEPTLRRDFELIVQRASALGFRRISLCTNGRRLRDPDYAERLVEAGLTRVTLSIHSHLEDVENAICRRRRAFADKLAGIQNLVGLESRLVDGFALNSCIHGANRSRLAAQAAFFRGMGVREIRFNWLRPEGLALTQPRWAARLEHLPAAIWQLVLWNESRGRMAITFSDVPWCAYPSEIWEVPGLAPRYVGELRDLETQVVVQRPQGRDEFSWRERRSQTLKAKPAACASCGAAEVCEGVWQLYLDLFGTQGISPLDRDAGQRIRQTLESRSPSRAGTVHD